MARCAVHSRHAGAELADLVGGVSETFTHHGGEFQFTGFVLQKSLGVFQWSGVVGSQVDPLPADPPADPKLFTEFPLHYLLSVLRDDVYDLDLVAKYVRVVDLRVETIRYMVAQRVGLGLVGGTNLKLCDVNEVFNSRIDYRRRSWRHRPYMYHIMLMSTSEVNKTDEATVGLLIDLIQTIGAGRLEECGVTTWGDFHDVYNTPGRLAKIISQDSRVFVRARFMTIGLEDAWLMNEVEAAGVIIGDASARAGARRPVDDGCVCAMSTF